jgi:hypothetical protein
MGAKAERGGGGRLVAVVGRLASCIASVVKVGDGWDHEGREGFACGEFAALNSPVVHIPLWH